MTPCSNPTKPFNEPEPGPVDKRFPITVDEWQLYFIVTGAFVLVAKRLQMPRPSEID